MFVSIVSQRMRLDSNIARPRSLRTVNNIIDESYIPGFVVNTAVQARDRNNQAEIEYTEAEMYHLSTNQTESLLKIYVDLSLTQSMHNELL